MSSRVSSVLAFVSWVLASGALALLAVTEASGLEDNLFHYQDAAVGLAFPALGRLVLRRLGSHPIGWILMMAGLSGAAGAFAEEYVTVGVEVHPGTLPAVTAVGWFGSWTWAFFFALLPVFLLLFPDGKLPSPRWRPWLWLAVGSVVILPAVLAVATWGAPIETFAGSAEPEFPPPLQAIFEVSVVAVAASLLVSLAALAARWRRSAGVARQQMKVFLACAVTSTGCLVLSQLDLPGGEFLGVVSFLLVPAGMVAAILRYRLYDIDRLVSRTVTYAMVTALLVGIYLSVVFLLQAILPVASDLATAGSTLVAAAAFSPLRRRVQAFVDRRFNRSRYDAELIAERFGKNLRSRAGGGELSERLERVVAETLEPSHLSVWIRDEILPGRRP